MQDSIYECVTYGFSREQTRMGDQGCDELCSSLGDDGCRLCRGVVYIDSVVVGESAAEFVHVDDDGGRECANDRR